MFLFISHIIVSYKLVPKESINVHLYIALTSTPRKCHKQISLKHVNVCIFKVLNDSLTKYNCCYRVRNCFLYIIYLLRFKLVPPEGNVVNINSYKLVP